LRKKVNPGASQGFAVFAGVFEGCFGKSVCWWMVFCGEVVVGCVVNVVFWRSLFSVEKWDRFLKFIFVGIGKKATSLRLRCEVAWFVADD
jgi:hypothetical protein